jgi:hypothetical protein
MHKLSISTTPTSNNPTELPPSPRRRGQRNINETVISACRGAQLILGILILSLSASLSTRWTALSTTCGPGPNTTDCSKTLQGAGGLKYCVFVGVWVLFDFGLWVVDAFVMKNGIPTIVLIFGGQFTGGFAMGGGCVSNPFLFLIRVETSLAGGGWCWGVC